MVGFALQGGRCAVDIGSARSAMSRPCTYSTQDVVDIGTINEDQRWLQIFPSLTTSLSNEHLSIVYDQVWYGQKKLLLKFAFKNDHLSKATNDGSKSSRIPHLSDQSVTSGIVFHHLFYCLLSQLQNYLFRSPTHETYACLY